MKVNMKGVEMFLFKPGATTLDVVPTAISNAAPAVVTVADVTGIIEGMPVMIADTGYDTLDGKLFVVGTVDGTANTLELLGSDSTNDTATAVGGTSPLASVYDNTGRVKICLASLDINPPSVNQIDLVTFCAESTMAGRATPGQITMTGYAEKDSDGFAELQAADDDGLERIFEIVLPGDNGYLIGSITLSGLGWQTPIEGALGFTISGSQTRKIVYQHN